MTAKPKPPVLAVGSDRAFAQAQSALGAAVRLIRAQPADAEVRGRRGAARALADVRFERSRMIRLFPVVCCAKPRRARSAAVVVNVQRLAREYGDAAASEILRQVVISRLHAENA